MSILLTSYVATWTLDSTIYPPHQYAQTFYHSEGSDYLLDTVQAYLKKLGSPGTITVEVQETTAGEPNGSVVDSTTYDGDTLGADYSFVTLTFAGTETLVSGVTYAIVISAPNGTWSNLVRWASRSPGGYTRGSRWYFDGASWLEYSTYDLLFRVYGSSAGGDEELAGTIAATGGISGVLIAGQLPSKPTTPDPADVAIDQRLNLVQITWVDPDA